MNTYRIIPLKVAQQEPRANTSTYLQLGAIMESPIIAYLIVGSGLTILVDTGCGPEQWSMEKHHFKITITPEMEILTAIRNAGVDPEKIDFLINTHLHHDHCWNNFQFPGKKIYVQKDEISYAINPDPCQWYYYETPQVGMTPPWLKDMDRFEIVDGDTQIADGIELIKFCGHTAGSQGVLVNTTDGKYLIAGDVISTYANWEGDSLYKHIPVGIHINVQDCYRDYEKIEKLGVKMVFPGHDPRVFEHKSYPVEK